MSIKCIGFAIDLVAEECGLTASEKAVLIVLTYRADEESGWCFPSLSYIGQRTDLSKDTVRRAIRALSKKGWLVYVPRQRENGSHSSHDYVVDLDKLILEYRAQKAREAAEKKKAGTRQEVREGAEGVVASCNHPYSHDASRVVAPCDPHIESDINKYKIAREREGEAEEWRQVHNAIVEAAGDALDTTSPTTATSYTLRLLLIERENNPACTYEELIEGVKVAADWYRKRRLMIRSWEAVIRFVCKLRDDRLNGVPVKVPDKPKTVSASLGDPSGWDAETWARMIDVAKYRKAWKAEWGPEPGQPGTLVPETLWPLWVD